LRGRVGDVLVARFGVADETRGKPLDVLASGVAVVHINGTVQDDEDYGSARRAIGYGTRSVVAVASVRASTW